LIALSASQPGAADSAHTICRGAGMTTGNPEEDSLALA
jgi:hypothetical protein